MAKGLICDRCGAVIRSKDFGQVNMIEITPHVGLEVVAALKSKSFDLCKECTETLIQYINNEVDMVMFNNGRAADDQTDNCDPGL